MNQHLHHRRPAIGQQIRAIVFCFTGCEVLVGTYSEDSKGAPMIDGVKLHPMRTEWQAA